MTGDDTRPDRMFYGGIWSILVRWFRVPDRPPTLPPTDEEAEPESFRPALGFLKYLRIGFAILFGILILAVGAAIVALTIVAVVEKEYWLYVFVVPLLLLVVFLMSLSWVGLHLRYDTTWYVMSDRSLRIRRGIWTIAEITVTFENVQNVKVLQGPIQRALGIANLVVETAGGGMAASSQGTAGANQAIIEGIADPAKLRDKIMRRLRESTSAGLGDEIDDDGPIVGGGFSAGHVEVLREIRNALARRAG